MKRLRGGSRLLGQLPDGCSYCGMGAKMVLLVTGLCSTRCFYCPLSEKKMGKDVIFANERKIEDEKDDLDIIEEAESIEALGTGITGGEPLMVMERVLSYISLLKEHFGKEHHIHLYTAVPATREQLLHLKETGLDEIRFHLGFDRWYPWFTRGGGWDGGVCEDRDDARGLENESFYFERTLRDSLELGLDTGVEIPLIPGDLHPYLSLICYLDDLGVQFLNLNELEYSPTNYEKLNRRGWQVKSDISSAVKGSETQADEIFQKLEEQERELALAVHFCTVSFKDGVQLRNRLIRQAQKRAGPHEIVTEDGTLVKGILEFPEGSTKTEMANYLGLIQEKLPETAGMLYLNTKKKLLETSFDIIEDIAKLTPFPCFIVENYPSADGLEVEREPVGGDADGDMKVIE